MCVRHRTTPPRAFILSIDAPASHSFTVSCDEIPGYVMAAMEMPLLVRDAQSLLATTQARRHHPFPSGRAAQERPTQEDIHPIVNFEAEPAEAGALTALRSSVNPDLKPVSLGEPVPDFTLTDQAQQKVSLSSPRGKVIALTFGYSRCPNPNYCLRLSRNLAQVEQRFHAQAGRDLILVTIAIDQEFDPGPPRSPPTPASFQADPQSWHFLTGPLPQIRQVAAQFGFNFWNTEGLLTHTCTRSSSTARATPQHANIDGNAFTAKQLGDLVQSVLHQPD